MSTNDEREALRECPFCGGKAMRKEDPGVIGEMFGLVVDHAPGCFLTLRGVEADEVFDAAWNTRPLPAPTPAAGEAVAWMYEMPNGEKRVFSDRQEWKVARPIETPLYAAPQPPATGGDAVEPLRRAIMAAENLLAELEGSEAELDAEDQAVVHGAKQDIAFARAALANHSPDAGGVGEAWVCDGIPDEVIEAGISAWDAAKHDMENYVSGVTTDWDEGMIVAAIYKAMSPALNPADAEGGSAA